MAKKGTKRVFDTDRRIRLGIWGLGRGMSFYRTCQAVQIDVVAGCDYNEHMRERFARDCPGAFVTDDAEQFLSRDFDAVLLATYCPDHAAHAIRCLAAGKHVVSEVTAFHTLAEGVELVEAVEKSGRVYQLAENYPYTAANMWLARRWKEGLFGELMYAEYEYVHECRSLCYTYIDGVPMKPGHCVHNWRSWINFHYYCTHSLGPVMFITGRRPVRVVALPGAQKLAGYPERLPEGMGGISPSLINMDNGSVVRNLMGATTNDSHVQRIWGTLGAAEINVGKPLQVRLGASGGAAKLEVTPHWDELGELAVKTGHGGGDFWVLYYFAREILTGEKGFFDVYRASDVTLPGILALRSALEGGRPQEVPDFRDPDQRHQHRDDRWAQKRLATDAMFPPDADPAVVGHFSTTMANLIAHALRYRQSADSWKVKADLVDPAPLAETLQKLIDSQAAMKETYADARRIVDAYPASEGARVLREMLVDIGGETEVLSRGFSGMLKRRLAAIRGKRGKKGKKAR